MKSTCRKRPAAAPILLALCLAGGVAETQAALVLDVDPGGNQAPCGDCGNTTGATFGWAFDVTGSITVDGIGVWDTGFNGFGTTVQAGLWTNVGALLATVSVSDSSTPVGSASGAGQWLFEDIAPITLDPGSYLIGSIFFDSVPTANVGSFVTIPEITGVAGRRGSSPDGGLQVPTIGFNAAIFGPTLRQVESPVPAPATALLLAFGAGGLARRRRTE